ncbi:MAG: ATP-binding cassette domain-containing protein, partial [Coriobacteriia bacterium]|nr:ATP-binding cassette domain-containing protein [Coriobacteriia bacterium]
MNKQPGVPAYAAEYVHLGDRDHHHQHAVILDVADLSVSFNRYNEGLGQSMLTLISNLNVRVREGEILTLVGSSGSGKSLLAHAILGILAGNAQVSGTIS